MKCPICNEEVAGDPIVHLKTQSHEAALAKLIESEKGNPPNKACSRLSSSGRVLPAKKSNRKGSAPAKSG